MNVYRVTRRLVDGDAPGNRVLIVGKTLGAALEGTEIGEAEKVELVGALHSSTPPARLYELQGFMARCGVMVLDMFVNDDHLGFRVQRGPADDSLQMTIADPEVAESIAEVAMTAARRMRGAGGSVAAPSRSSGGEA